MKVRKKQLDNDDLYEALPSHKSGMLGDQICAAWKDEVLKDKPSLLRAIAKTFGRKIVIVGLALACLEFMK